MILKAYKDARFQYVKARDFAVFKADSKYVMGITPDGCEWLLDAGVTLKTIEVLVADLVRINRGVLVKACHITGCERGPVGGPAVVTVTTTVGEYRLARRISAKPILALVEANNKRGPTRPRKPTTELPE